jgi:hypothetical protein
VDLSKLKLEVYDLLGLILPGLVLICEGWILLRGWHAFAAAINQISGTSLTLLLLVAFGAGNAVQELGDVTVKRIKGVRFPRAGRDRFWLTPEAEIVRNKINTDLGHAITSADLAFDYCLTKLKDRFAKRDIFLATSDLCRSFVILSVLALLPAFRVSIYDLHRSWPAFALFCVLALIFSFLMWKRMVRFRELSETTVFRVYLAILNESKSPS